jgi:hypothetical protein
MFTLILIAMGLIGLKSITSGPGTMSPQDRLTFQGLIAAEDPSTTGAEFLKYATYFDGKGLRYEAQILRKRARIANLPPAARAAVKQAFSAAMSSRDSTFIRTTANTFEAEGFWGNAEALRDQANAVDVGNSIAITQAMQASQAAAAAATQQAIQQATPAQVAAAARAGAAPTSGTIATSGPLAGYTAAEIAAAKVAIGMTPKPTNDGFPPPPVDGATAAAGVAMPTPGAASAAPPAAGAPTAGAKFGPENKPSMADWDNMRAQEAAQPGSTR